MGLSPDVGEVTVDAQHILSLKMFLEVSANQVSNYISSNCKLMTSFDSFYPKFIS